MTKQKKDQQTIFAVVNLANEKGQQLNTINYAAEMGKLLNLPLVLYPRIDQTNLSFKDGFTHLHRILQDFSCKFSVSRHTISIFQTVNDIARMENAAFIIMGVRDEKQPLVQKITGMNMWDLAAKSDVPVILVPPNTRFNGFGEITIAVDAENKVQKMKYLNLLAHEAVVHVFVDNPANNMANERTKAVLNNIEKYLRSANLVYEIEFARNQTEFPLHLLRYAIKNSQLLILEVDKQKLSGALRQHIQKFLFGTKRDFAIMLVKTKPTGISSWK